MRRITAAIRKKARGIKLLLLDVDGVLTDGRIVVDYRGRETKSFDVRDGQGIRLLERAGIEVGIISGRSSPAVNHRARDLGIKIVYQGIDDKVAAYEEIKRSSGLSDGAVAYIGDDLADLPLLRRVGLSIAVADGWSALESECDCVTGAAGGRGAVREVAEFLLKAQSKWQIIARSYLA